MHRVLAIAAACIAFNSGAGAQDRPTMSGVLESSKASDWRRLDPSNTLYMQLEKGRVVFELAPDFAPVHIENIRKLVANRYFDGLAIIRSQDNYVAQWGDPEVATRKIFWCYTCGYHEEDVKLGISIDLYNPVWQWDDETTAP